MYRKSSGDLKWLSDYINLQNDTFPIMIKFPIHKLATHTAFNMSFKYSTLLDGERK